MNMDKTAFTGFKNICYIKDYHARGTVNQTVQRFFNVELDGKDLIEFQTLAKNCNKKYGVNYINSSKPDSVNIFYFNAPNVGKGFALNGNLLPVTRETVPVFQYIANLTSNITKSATGLSIESLFLDKKKVLKNLIMNDNISLHSHIIPEIDNEKVKLGAAAINKGIQIVMNRFLGI